MNIFKSTKKSNTIFFASLLLVGTIAAALSPLFMLGNAQAEPYYGMDKDRKDVSVSSLKCNNINVNVNGLELDILSPSLSTLLTGGEADATAYSYGGGNGNYGSGPSGSETDFKFICINNNNNTVIGVVDGKTPILPPTPVTTCEDCFSVLSETQITSLIEIVRAESIAEFCDRLSATVNSNDETEIVIIALRELESLEEITSQQSEAIIECLIDIGVIEP